MPHHLEPVPPVQTDGSWEPPDEPDGGDRGDDGEPIPHSRPSWWRWVAIAVALALILATPFAYALDKLLT